jgi:cytochrome c7-like protein/class III cytochrome C family protein
MPSGRRNFAGNNWNPLLLVTLVTFTGAFDRLGGSPGQEPTEARSSKPGAAVEQPKAQPIPFSHKLHASFIKDCLTCHAMSGSGWEMSYPPEANCMECHATISTKSPAINKLAAYYNEHKAVPWVKIYKLPDEILFSHKRHVKSKVECTACHGPVAEREVVTKERSIWMEFCVDCHKDRKAPSTCRSCHNR